ncbi:hypothetical protein CEXT_624451 [Caerostris extrusa]|uniref:Uncharacterized protein n=1 Tax=Caerostris extrusa TaxID=172846 RepID=A0AAV4NPU4_CAEEX|nr:hypothetical protein CEXT_624451 [Caerostris extrusa]
MGKWVDEEGGCVGGSDDGGSGSLSGNVCFQIAFHSVSNSRSSVFELDESTRGFCRLSVMLEAKKRRAFKNKVHSETLKDLGCVGGSGDGRFESLSGNVCFKIAFHSVPNSRSSVFELHESTRGFCRLSVMLEDK